MIYIVKSWKKDDTIETAKFNKKDQALRYFRELTKRDFDIVQLTQIKQHYERQHQTI